MTPLPRQLRSADPREILAWARQVNDFLASLPRFEIKEVTASSEVSHTIKTNLQRPVGLLVTQAYKTNNVDETVSIEALPDWRPVDGGLKHRIDTSGVNHTFRYLVIGK